MTTVGELDQRFYTSQFGRFLSADRFMQAAKANDSVSWNKYLHVQGDPANKIDANGADSCEVGLLDGGEGDACWEDPTFSVTVTMPLTWDIPIVTGTWDIGAILARLLGPVSIVVGVIASPTPSGGPDEDCYEQLVAEG
jgi:RHS repeat-associated protein